MSALDDIDTCKACGSTSLWGNFFGRDGLADENGKWDILCEDCGQLQSRRIKRGPKVGASEMQRVTLSTLAVSDHLSRLYTEGPTNSYQHIDVPGALVEVYSSGDRTMTIGLTKPARRELFADAEYQWECAVDDGDATNRSLWKRVMTKLKESSAVKA